MRLIALSALLLLACAPTFNLQVTKPAEVDMMGLKRLAVGDIEGPAGKELSLELTSALFDTKAFELVDRTHLNQVFQEVNFTNSGMADEATVLQMGKMLGSAAMVFGRVTGYETRDEYTEAVETDSTGKQRTTYVRTVRAQMIANLQVTDLTTGKILAIKDLTGVQTRTDRNPMKNWPDPDKKQLLRGARAQVVGQFVRAIAPYSVWESVRFEKDDDDPDMERGIQFLKTGDLGRAADAFAATVVRRPNWAPGLFNLGTAQLCLGQFDGAIENLDKAYAQAPSADYAAQKARAIQWKEDAARVRAQKAGKSSENAATDGLPPDDPNAVHSINSVP
jgi:tetratricopeptide (TPR) repeat protein